MRLPCSTAVAYRVFSRIESGATASTGNRTMNRDQLTQQSEAFLRSLIRENLPPRTPVYLFGSRARGDARWNSDFDLWIDADIDPSVLVNIDELLEESFVPFHVDLVTTRQLNNTFGAVVRKEAKPWM